MKWKLLILLALFIILGYTIYMGIQLYWSGYPFTFENFFAFTITQTFAMFEAITLFVQEKWQLVMTTVGASVTAILGIYRVIKNKISGIQQTAQSQVDTVQSQATQQYVTMQDTITQQKTQLTTQTQQIESLQQQLATAPTQSQLDAKDQEIQKLISDMNAMERSYQNTIQFLKQQQVVVTK